MKEIALTINGADFPTITSVQPIMDKAGSLGKNILGVAIEFLLVATVVIALFSLLLGGIQWISSGGNKEKLQAAQNRVTFSVIGLVLVFLAFLIIGMIGFFFNISIIKLTP